MTQADLYDQDIQRNSPIVYSKGDVVYTTSHDVAAFFGRSHKNILRAIDLLHCSPEFRRLNFEPTTVRTQVGAAMRNRPGFTMTKDGFTFLVMGFIGEQAGAFKEAYIQAFNAMEAQLRAAPVADPMKMLSDPATLRGLLANYSEKVIALESQVEQLGERVEVLDRIEAAQGSMAITDAAKTLKMRPNELFRFMSGRRWIFKRTGSSNWLAYQDKIQAGYMEHSEYVYRDKDDQDRVRTTARVTAKGLVKLAELLNKPLH